MTRGRPVAPVEPVAVVLKVEPTRTTRLVPVRCPFCQKTHTHGWPYTSPAVGPRVAHCHRPKGGTARSYDVEHPVGQPPARSFPTREDHDR